MAKNTSITLGDHFESIIENSIASGRYASASEVIRAGLRKIDEEEQKIIIDEILEINKKEALKRFKMYSLKYEYAELHNQKTQY